MSIGLSTRARVTLSSGPGRIRFSDKLLTSKDSRSLAQIVVRKTLALYDCDEKFHGEVETFSEVPSAVGLKSSSAAANAVALATVSAISEEPRDNELIEIGLDASVESGVSRTGAFDDSFASYYGGAVLTDNTKRTVERVPEITQDLQILLLITESRKTNVPLDSVSYSPIRNLLEQAYDRAIKGQIWDALTLNGLSFSSALGQDPLPALAAIDAGALGAGLSGKGPAIAAITTRETSEAVRQSLESFGQVIQTQPNFLKASIQK